jgi:SOS-response transcriptional repressor LexA
MNKLATPSDRLRHAREQAHYATASDAARAMGIEEPTYLGHENGNRGLGRAGQRYARFYGVSLDWLLDGRGSMRPTPPQLERSRPGRRRPAPRGLEEDGRPYRQAALHADGRIGIPPGEIPQVAAQIGMGLTAEADQIQIPLGGGAVAALPVTGTWKLPDVAVNRLLAGASLESVHVIEGVGDSMEPIIRSGDMVFIDTSQRSPSPPGIFALYDGIGITMKHLEVVPNTDPVRVKIIPENSRYSSYDQELDEIRIIGRYVGRFTKD